MYDMKALYQAESVQDAVALRVAHPDAQIIELRNQVEAALLSQRNVEDGQIERVGVNCRQTLFTGGRFAADTVEFAGNELDQTTPHHRVIVDEQDTNGTSRHGNPLSRCTRSLATDRCMRCLPVCCRSSRLRTSTTRDETEAPMGAARGGNPETIVQQRYR